MKLAKKDLPTSVEDGIVIVDEDVTTEDLEDLRTRGRS